MTHEIEPIDHWIGGDTSHIPFTVPDEDADDPDARKDLSGAEISWQLLDRSGEVVLSTDDDGVSITVSTPTSDGEFRVEIAADTGDELEGVYEQWVQIYLASGNRQTWKGQVNLTKNELSVN